MNIQSINKVKGIGLIEVLVAVVVVAFGLLAVASMQGNFLSSSGDSKARAEALVIAERKMEDLRNLTVLGDYTAIATTTDTHTGVNATFTRVWTVTDQSTPTRKEIDVTVTWGAASADETVALNSEIAFSDPAISASLAAYGEQGAGSYGQSPNPNQNASETVTDAVNISTVDSGGNQVLLSGTTDVYIVQDGSGNNIYVQDNGGGTSQGSEVFLISSLTQFDVDLTKAASNDGNSATDVYLYTRRLDDDGVTGNEVIEIFTDNGDGTATRQHRYFGGVIVSIKGTIRTIYNLDDIKIDFNKEDMLCVFNPGSLQTARDYACYTGGSCNVSPAGDNSDVNRCPDPSAADVVVGAGGFSGNVGLLNVDDAGGNKESVCFAGDLAGTSTTISTTRKYNTTNPNSSPTEEGINESYNCQDFFIIGRQANLTRLAARCSAAAGSFNLPPKEIERTISSNADNIAVVAANNTYCTALVSTTYTLTGNITGGPSGVSTTTVSAAGNTCTVNTASSPWTYSCTVTTSGTAVDVQASNVQGSSTRTGSCTVGGLSPASGTGTCDIALSLPPTYTATGTITGINGTGGLTVEVTDDVITNACSPLSGSPITYTCVISTNENSIRIEATKGSGNDSCVYSSLSSAETTIPRTSPTVDAACVLEL